MATDTPPNGTRGKWPTASAINNRIVLSNKANNRTSPLTGMGDAFLEFGNRYGINPGVVVAMLQRESQLGADGTILPSQCNNFGGVTGEGTAGYCTVASGIHGREWAKYKNAKDGLEQNFKLLDSTLYRATGGRLQDIINLYSPAFENNHDEIFTTFAAVGSNLGIEITRDTNIYTNGGTGGNPSSSGMKTTTMADWFLDTFVNDTLEKIMYRSVLFLLGIGLLYVGLTRVL